MDNRLSVLAQHHEKLGDLEARKQRAAKQPLTWWHGRLDHWDPPGEPNTPPKGNPYPRMRETADPAEREQIARDRGLDREYRIQEKTNRLIEGGHFRIEDGGVYGNDDNPPTPSEDRQMRKLMRGWDFSRERSGGERLK